MLPPALGNSPTLFPVLTHSLETQTKAGTALCHVKSERESISALCTYKKNEELQHEGAFPCNVRALVLLSFL